MPNDRDHKSDAEEETAHLLSSPLNAERLREAIAQLDDGGGEERDLVDQ